MTERIVMLAGLVLIVGAGATGVALSAVYVVDMALGWVG